MAIVGWLAVGPRGIMSGRIAAMTALFPLAYVAVTANAVWIRVTGSDPVSRVKGSDPLSRADSSDLILGDSRGLTPCQWSTQGV
jgi:hypothetical protein